MNDPYRAAIVGAGPGGLIAYACLRYAGLPAEDIVVLDDRGAPLSAWMQYTSAIEQRFMRSESEGHFFPTDFPGFALMDALHARSPLPLMKSSVNRYTPSLESVLRHGRGLARFLNMQESVQTARVQRVVRDYESVPRFALYSEDGTISARAQHVFLALGHGALRWPAACASQDVRSLLSGALFHAYEPKSYDVEHVVVVGGGMAAVSEWIRALEAGATVTAVHRSDRLVEQALSAPRCAFGGPWLDRYHGLDSASRLRVLEETGRGTFPTRSRWKQRMRQAEKDGKLILRAAEVTSLDRGACGQVRVELRGADGEDVALADMVVAATGFSSAWNQYEILAELVGDHHLTTHGPYVELNDDCTVAGLSLPDSVLSVGGPAARWAYPAADSFAGMKYAARRFSRRVAGGRRPGRRASFWPGMVRGGWPYRNLEDPRVGSEPCASL